MTGESFRFAQIFCWALPGLVAAWSWGAEVGLLTFGAQMFSAPSATRLYAGWRANRGPVEAEDMQRFNLLANLVCGAVYAMLARLIVGGAAPG